MDKAGIWEKIQAFLQRMTRKRQGKDECPRHAIVDSQSIKNSEWGIPYKGFDGNRKVKGRKRHIMVYTGDDLKIFSKIFLLNRLMINMENSSYIKDATPANHLIKKPILNY